MDSDRVNCFSALVKRYLMVDFGSFLASLKSKISLAMKGTPATLQPPPPKRKWAYPPSDNPLMYLLVGGAPKKLSLFSQHFLNENECLGPEQDIFIVFEA
jgi:hypothetical protein